MSSANLKIKATDFYHLHTNDSHHTDLNAVDLIDIKPVTLIEVVNRKNNRIRAKPYMAFLDTGSAKSHVKAELSQFGDVVKDESLTFRTANGKLIPNFVLT